MGAPLLLPGGTMSVGVRDAGSESVTWVPETCTHSPVVCVATWLASNVMVLSSAALILARLMVPPPMARFAAGTTETVIPGP